MYRINITAVASLWSGAIAHQEFIATYFRDLTHSLLRTQDFHCFLE